MVNSTPTLSGQVYLYKDIELLNSEVHSRLGLSSDPHRFAFAAKETVLPLLATEFGKAALHYPIVFAGEAKRPVVVMGTVAGQNLFISVDGSFAEDAYVPAHLRRYPFALADEADGDRSLVCIDRAAAFLNETQENALFVDGTPSAVLQNAIEFLNAFEADARRTDAFIALLIEHDLFEVKHTIFTPHHVEGQPTAPRMVADYYAISETKFAELSMEAVKKLHDTGALACIHAHFLSLYNWERLIERSLKAATADSAALAAE